MKKIIETAYAENADITFIMEYIETDSGEPIQTAVIGWHYGEPDPRYTAHYIGKTTAYYEY